MSKRIVGTHLAAVLAFLGGIAAADVAPIALVGPGHAVILPNPSQPQPTELDKAYYYSTIGQELAYAKVRENAAQQTPAAAPKSKSQAGIGLGAPSAVSPLFSAFCPGISTLCPAPSRLLSRLEAAGCRL